MSTHSNHDKSKSCICEELKTVLNAAQSSQYTEKQGVPSEITQNICNVIEAIFIHGLRDPFFVKGSRYAKYPEPNIWPFVSKFSEKKIIEEVNSLKQIRSEIGRGRAWIRIVINQSNLEHHLHLLIRETKAISQFYDQHAFLRDVEQVEKIDSFLKGLDELPICAAVNSSMLNTWTPSPLILAGLVSGKPLKVGDLTPRRRALSLQDDMEKIGRPAADLLLSEHTPNTIVSIYGKGMSSKNVHSDDSSSSVYSHPSLLGSTDDIPEQVILSSSPLQDIVATLPPQNVAPLIVSRRTKRPRRSRSGSENNSEKTHSESEYENTLIDALDTSTISNGHPPIGAGLHVVDDTAIQISEKSSTNCGGSVTNTSNSENLVCLATSLSVVHADKKYESSPLAEHDDMSGGTEEVHGEVFDQLPDVSFDGKIEHSNNNATNQTSKRHDQEDSVLGTSPFDEMSLLEVPPSSNSLLSTTWSKPRRSMSNPERSNSAQLSTSSGTDVEVGVISFDQALCSTMEGGESSKKMKVNFGDSERNAIGSDMESDIDEKLWWRKSSIVDADRMISIMTTIPREIGLDAQNFHCPMCRKLIGAEFSNYGICGIDGLYYCSDCMNAGGEVVIPSRILRSWDWRPRPVSDRGRAFFEANQDSVVFHIDQQNPTLYDHVPALKIVKCLREKLQIASMYLFNCRESIAEDFRKRVWPRNHLYSDVHAYSVSDMILLRSGLLEKQITGFLAHAIDHIMHCFLCRQKGFVCEVCEARSVIYPFQTETTYKCSHCSSVFHATCVSRTEDCPKCIRRAKYEIQQEASDLPLD